MGKLDAPGTKVVSPSSGLRVPGVLSKAIAGALLAYNADANAWTDGGDVDAALGVNVNTDYIYASAGEVGNVQSPVHFKTVSDGNGGYVTKMSTDAGQTYNSGINSTLVAYDPSLEGHRLKVSGYCEGTDELTMWTYEGGYYFTVKGLGKTGTIQSWADLKGGPSATGSCDESTGRFFGTDDLGSTFGIAEFFSGQSPVTIYDGPLDEAAPQVDLSVGAGKAFVKDPENGDQLYVITDLTDSKKATATAITGFTGTPCGITKFNGHDALYVLKGGQLQIVYDETSAKEVSDLEKGSTLSAGETVYVDANNPDSYITVLSGDFVVTKNDQSGLVVSADSSDDKAEVKDMVVGLDFPASGVVVTTEPNGRVEAGFAILGLNANGDGESCDPEKDHVDNECDPLTTIHVVLTNGGYNVTGEYDLDVDKKYKDPDTDSNPEVDEPNEDYFSDTKDDPNDSGGGQDTEDIPDTGDTELPDTGSNPDDTEDTEEEDTPPKPDPDKDDDEKKGCLNSTVPGAAESVLAALAGAVVARRSTNNGRGEKTSSSGWVGRFKASVGRFILG